MNENVCKCVIQANGCTRVGGIMRGSEFLQVKFRFKVVLHLCESENDVCKRSKTPLLKNENACI